MPTAHPPQPALEIARLGCKMVRLPPYPTHRSRVRINLRLQAPTHVVHGRLGLLLSGEAANLTVALQKRAPMSATSPPWPCPDRLGPPHGAAISRMHHTTIKSRYSLCGTSKSPAQPRTQHISQSDCYPAPVRAPLLHPLAGGAPRQRVADKRAQRT